MRSSNDDNADERWSMDRRALLGSLASAGVAGCLGMGGDGDGDRPSGGGFQTVRPDTATEPAATETATPTPTAEPTATAPATSAGGTATEPTSAGGGDEEWPTVDDPYYSALQDRLAAMGLPPGEFVYAKSEAETLKAFQVWGGAAETSSLSVSDDLPFSAARRVEVTEAVDNPWDVTMNGTVTARSVSEGDVLLGVVYLRGAVSSQKDPTVQFVAKDQDNAGTNMVTTQSKVTPPLEWTRYYVPMQWSYDSEAGTWWWEMFHGFGVQTTDVGGIALVDFDQSVAVEDLPSGPVGGG